jgi:CRP-like cAMP-binding protein
MNDLFTLLNAVEMARLEQTQSEARFVKGEFLFRSGEPVRGIYCIQKGTIKISQPLPGGARAVTVRFASIGDWVGHRSIFTSATFRGSALAKERVEASFVPMDTLIYLFGSNKEFANQLIRLIARDLEQTEKRLMEFPTQNVPSRLISLFRSLNEKFGEDTQLGRQLSLRLTKVEISELIGASQEVVSRQLSKWKKESLIREEGKKLFLSDHFLNRVIRGH